MFEFDPALAKVGFVTTVLYLLVVVLEWASGRRQGIPIIATIIAVAVLIFIYFVLRPFSGVQTFGPPPTVLIILMFVSVAAGGMAEYLFRRKRRFSLSELLRPILISPLLLLPLIGLLQQAQNPDPYGIFSLLLVSFQNGFFWKEMMEKFREAL